MAAEQITQRLTPLPEAPDRKAPADFADKSDAFVAAQVGMVEEVNQMADEINAVAEAVNADAERADTAKGYASDAWASKEAAEAAKTAAEAFSNSTASDRTAVSADRAQVQQIADTFTDLDAALASATQDADRAELAATNAQSVVTQDLSAIAAEISGTAVDVFIYDTTKDSDGGAWRKRCQHTSWYNEPLNTATRGARREFPAVAVIVVEASKVTIYDGDDPALPMWMVFTSGVGPNSTYNLIVNGINCLSMRDGLMVFGRNYGIYAACFLRDECAQASTTGSNNFGGRNLAQRNEYFPYGSTPSRILTAGIAHATVYDVAITALPDAPINLETGLPVPTITAATAGGLSVIKDDMTVWKVTGSYLEHDLAFNKDWSVVSVGRAADRAFKVALSGDRFAFETNGGNNTQSVLTLDIRNETRALALEDATSYAGRAVKFIGGGGLSQLAFNRANPAGSMVAYSAADFASGWMVGDTKGAFLADTDETALVSEDFSIQSLTVDDLTISDGVTVTDLGDRLRITKDATDGLRTPVLVSVGAVTAGVTYFAECELLATGDNNNCYFGASNGGGTTFLGASYHSEGFVKRGFSVATGAGTGGIRFGFEVSRSSNPAAAEAGDWVEISKALTVRRADFDRSGYKSGLIINGTLTREPVSDGAELVAYSGFSADNYLSQPYSADLDFGAGDFCVMGWARGQRSTQCIFDRGEGASGLALEIFNGGLLVKTGNSYIVPTLNVNLTDGNWNSVAVVRRSGVLFLYVNGAEVYSAANVKDVSAPTIARVGVRLDGSRYANDLALVRIGATAPTTNQIRKIYEDERELFKAGAACTLHGASSAVKALAYDDVTDLLHVGTSAGRSVFKGLRRIDQTDTPVTTAIAASGGMIVEA